MARQTMPAKPAPNPPAATRERPTSTAAAGQKLVNGTRKPRLPSTHAHSTGNTAFPRGHCLLLGVLAMAHTASATMFATKATLSAALVEFCADQAAAEATHGKIGSWDVSAVTDMKDLIWTHAASCKDIFNADISGWVTSSVTNMQGMFYVRSARALPASSSVGSSPPCEATAAPRPPAAWPACYSSSYASLSTRQDTTAFNQPLSFDTSSVTNMYAMFKVRSARALPQQSPPCALLALPPPHALPSPGPYGACCPSSYASLSTRQQHPAFNQPLSFDTSSVIIMGQIFYVRSASALPQQSLRLGPPCALLAPPLPHTLLSPGPHATPLPMLPFRLGRKRWRSTSR